MWRIYTMECVEHHISRLEIIMWYSHVNIIMYIYIGSNIVNL